MHHFVSREPPRKLNRPELSNKTWGGFSDKNHLVHESRESTRIKALTRHHRRHAVEIRVNRCDPWTNFFSKDEPKRGGFETPRLAPWQDMTSFRGHTPPGVSSGGDSIHRWSAWRSTNLTDTISTFSLGVTGRAPLKLGQIRPALSRSRRRRAAIHSHPIDRLSGDACSTCSIWLV